MVILQIVAVVLALVMLTRALNLMLLMRWYAKPAAPGDVTQIRNRRIYYTLKGDQSPTIVIESGLACCSAEWWAIQDKLAETSIVLTYDRAGYGWSELAREPRTSRAIAIELKSLLDELELRPPYILVGHSQGGLYVNHFCRLYPDTVAGVVLLDPVSTDDVRFRQELLPRVYKRSGVDESASLRLKGYLSGFGFLRLVKPFILKSPRFATIRTLPKKTLQVYWNNLLAPKTTQAALNEYAQSHDPRNIVDLKNSGAFPPVPLTVLVHNPEKMRDDIMMRSNLSREEAGKVDQLRQELMRSHASLSPLGTIVQAETGNHSIHLAQPEFVVQIINDIVARNPVR
jgi:pimeloyl-ACP methyl ester carboxylesterase